MNSRKKLDERELMEMYKIEHYAFWFLFWALFASLFIQLIFFDASFKQIGAEWIIFMIAAIASAIAYYKGGHYDYYTKPGIKSYLFYSIIFTVVTDIVTAIAIYVHHNYYNMTGYIITVVLFGVVLFGIIFTTMALTGEAIRKRRKKLEEQFDDSDAYKK